MFHQANMHAFDYKGEKWSLVNLWSLIALKEVMTFINKLPVLTPPMVRANPTPDNPTPDIVILRA
jgi:hypothetical protein